MSRRRELWPALGFVVAVTCATLLPRQELRAPPRIGRDWLVSGDFHVHAFPGDGTLSPALLQREAARRNLHVIALTNHNQILHRHMPRSTAAAPLILNGVEVTTSTAHIMALGVRTPPSWRRGPTPAIAEIHAAGGVAIVAHPSTGDVARLDTGVVARADGIEITSALAARVDELRRMRAAGVRAPTVIGSSDFHHAAPLGARRTILLVAEVSERGVLDAIRAGRTAVPYEGRWIGDTIVSRAAAQHEAAILDHPDAATLIVGFAAWLALLVWVIRN